MLSKKISVATAAILLCASVASPASAERVQFRYNTDELTTYAGAQAVYRRMETEAAFACGDESTRPIRVQILKERCTQRLLADWVKGADNTNLNRVYAEAQNRKKYASNE